MADRLALNERLAIATVVKTAVETLERTLRSAMSVEAPGEVEVAMVEEAIMVAEDAGVDELTLSAAGRRLKELEERCHVALRQDAKGRLAEAISHIEMSVAKGGDESENHGALSLLLYIYDKHPPKKASLTLERLGEMAPTELEAIKKALLKAQRDYHPDRNQGMLRETLGHSPEEWEVLCLTICQQLALVYDKLYKGVREQDDDAADGL